MIDLTEDTVDPGSTKGDIVPSNKGGITEIKGIMRTSTIGDSGDLEITHPMNAGKLIKGTTINAPTEKITTIPAINIQIEEWKNINPLISALTPSQEEKVLIDIRITTTGTGTM